MSVLEVQGVSCGYGRSVVVRKLDLHVDRGEVVALLGANGAGKTTTLLTIAGVLPAVTGEIRLLGERVETWPASRVARHGAVLVPDDRGLFPKLTVRENLALSALPKAKTTDPLALFPELQDRLRTPAGLLSGGQQQMLAIARALQRAPKLLLIDELSFGLAPLVVQRLMPILRHAADETGVAVLLVEQHVHLALTIAARAYVLSHGNLTLSASAADLRDDVSLLHASYLGETDDTPTNERRDQ